MTTKYIIGIDEVGRGPLLGPVAVGIVVVQADKYQEIKDRELFWPGRDSKKLTEKRRFESYLLIEELKASGDLDFGVFFESNEIIDRYGIMGAIKIAIVKGLKNLADRLEINERYCRVLLDGGLKAPSEFLDQETIIRGDESELVIALASIAAKVLRDQKIKELATEVTNYDLTHNKGYGTAKHLADLKKYGPCLWHRKSFLRRLT